MQISGRDSNRYQTFTRRAALLAGVQGVAFIALAGRMYYLQVLKTDQYRMLAEENRVSMRLLAPLRGDVVDRFGRVLASNRQNYRAMLISEQTPDVEETLERLSRIVEIDDFTRKRIMRDIGRSPRFMPVTVAEDLSWDQFAQVNINEPDLAGILPDVGETRDYPYAEEFAHVLGYVAAVSEKDLEEAREEQPLLKLPGFRIGKEGIEKTYDRELRGVPGSSHVEVNAYGRVIRELAKDPGKPRRRSGADARSRRAAVRLGAAQGRVGQRRRDGHSFGRHRFARLRARLRSEPVQHGLRHGRLQGASGKPLSAADEQVACTACIRRVPPSRWSLRWRRWRAGIEPSHRVVCPGHYSLGNHVFHCWKKGGHGAVNMHDAIKHSCDVFFYDTAKRIGIDAIAEMAKKFGLGQTYDFEVPGEKAGLVPTPEWKRGAKGEVWHQGETVIAGIGQGYLLRDAASACGDDGADRQWRA